MDCQHLHDIEGLKFMPVTAAKRPIIKGWQTSQDKHDLTNCAGIGLVCGKLSGKLEVIDVDAKYDLTGKLFDNYKQAIHSADKTLLSKLVIQKTKGGGYHMLYRCSVISGNLKLANRASTQEEKDYTYKEAYDAYFGNEKIKDKTEEGAVVAASKARDGDKVRVLLETRGEGGYIMCFPSAGYEILYGDFYGISEITPEQREILHNAARQFNEVFNEVIVPKSQQPKVKGLSPFDDYNERGDVVALLESNGWRVVSQKGNKTHLLRPGQTTSQTSGNYDHSLKWFSVFTTSTEFDPEHGYRPYAVFAVLECNKDFSEASKKLIAMGYGERMEKAEKAPSTRVIQSRINTEDEDYSFLATGVDYDAYLQQVIDGTLPMGLTTGSPALDQHFLLKEGNLVMDNGHDNTGKSVWVWWLLMCAALYHDWKGIIYSSENTTGNFMRKMIQFYWGKPLRGFNAMTPAEYHIAKSFVEDHFKIIRAEEELYNYKDVLNMTKKARKKFPQCNFGMIDPYNSLKTDLSGFSKLSTHDYHYEALSELKSYGQSNKFGWFINHHAVTESLRKVDSEGYPVAPNKADTEGGGKVANKADDFFTVHRKTQHPIEWNVTEIHVRKIKDTETGGRPTPLNNPVRFRMIKSQSAFEEVLIEGGTPVDPIARWHQTKNANGDDEFKHWADRRNDLSFDEYKEAELRRANTLVPVKKMNGEFVANVPKSYFDNYEPTDGYIPDDEERKALEELIKKDKPF